MSSWLLLFCSSEAVATVNGSETRMAQFSLLKAAMEIVCTDRQTVGICCDFDHSCMICLLHVLGVFSFNLIFKNFIGSFFR